MTLLRKSYSLLLRLHDLWILLAWAGFLAAVMLNTFYHRNCFEFISSLDFTAPCQGTFDLALIFLAAVGAGIAFADFRMGVVGFLPAHIIASILFVAVLILPSFIGLTDQALFTIILDRAVVVGLKSQFPFALFFSFIGGLAGLYFGSKLSE